MSYSRDYLRALPIEMRKQYLTNFIQGYVNIILDAARNGETYVVLKTEKDTHGLMGQCIIRPYETYPTNDEIREALLEKFPGCSVTYEEKWVDVSAGKRELKARLTVDWS